MLHLKTSRMPFCSFKGRFVLEIYVNDLISSISFHIASILSISLVHLSVFGLFCLGSLSSTSTTGIFTILQYCIYSSACTFSKCYPYFNKKLSQHLTTWWPWTPCGAGCRRMYNLSVCRIIYYKILKDHC